MRRNASKMIERFAVAGFLIGVLILGTAHVAMAELLNISAVAFTPRAGSTFDCTPGDFSSALGEEFQGLLLNAGATYFANVSQPVPHSQVARFTLHFRDFDADFDITARLMAKRFATPNAFDPPIVMAQLTSSGFDDALRSVSTTAISNPVIDLNTFYYYVEISLACGAPMEAVGVQIEFNLPSQRPLRFLLRR